MSEEKKQENTEAEAVEEFAELDGLREPDFDPEEEAEQKAEKEAADELLKKQAAISAATAVGILEAGLGLTAPNVDVPNAHKQRVADKLAAVLYKYELTGLPGWLLAYREELEFAGALGIMGYGIVAQVKAAKRAEAEAKAKAEQEGGEHGEESESRAA